MRVQRLQFPGSEGRRLAGTLDLPEGEPRAFAIFTHCFTCSRESLAAARVARGLARHGFGVLRFDFAGLGESEGDFAETTFSSNVADLLAAAAYLRERHAAPALLVGHSLGGTAALAAASEIEEVKAIATIAAPSEPSAVLDLLGASVEQIRAAGEAEVTLAGRRFRFRRGFLDDAASYRIADRVATLRRALLVLHAPEDDTVSIDHATRIFVAARHPKSFVSLEGANHLLGREADGRYVADTIAAWVERYLEPAAPAPTTLVEGGTVRVEETRDGRYQQLVTAGRHAWLADEPLGVGGLDSGPSPYDLLLASLGACTSMTMRMYAERKGLALERVAVVLGHERIHAKDCANCETKEGTVSRIERVITIEGALSEAERARLLEIADRCPVHRTLTGEIVIVTRAGEAASTT